MAVECITVSLPNHKICSCKMHRLLTWKEFVHHSCVQQFYTIKTKPSEAFAYFATRIHVHFFCSLDCLKKNIKCKNSQMEFLQKTPQCIFHLTIALLPQQLGTCRVVSEPTLRLLRAGATWHQPAPASGCFRAPQALMWSRNSQLRCFWSQTH